jgi:hypothetical protein
MMSSYITINELAARIKLLCEEYLLLRSLVTSDVTVLERYKHISNLLYGALIVIYIWVANFNSYIEDNNLITLRIRMAHMGRLGLRDVGVGIETEIATSLPCVDSKKRITYRFSLAGGKIDPPKPNETSALNKVHPSRYPDFCGALYRRLEVLLDIITSERR